MKKLTNNQKKFLRARGHTLKSIVMVGQHGLSEAVLAELESTMTKHELLKIKKFFHCFSKICKYSVVLFILLKCLLSALNR
jgi:RNA-binding protein YhbY